MPDSKLFENATALWIAEWSVNKDEMHLSTLAEDVCCVFKNVFAERAISIKYFVFMCQNKQCNLCQKSLGEKKRDLDDMVICIVCKGDRTNTDGWGDV